MRSEKLGLKYIGLLGQLGGPMIPEKLIQMLTDEQFEEFSEWYHDNVNPEEMTEEEELYWHLIIDRLNRDYMMTELEQFPRFIDIIKEKREQ